MFSFIRRNAVAIVTSVAMAALIGGPVIAATDAKNADKVDGFHAVGSGTRVANRAGKLVATNAKGYLPNNIIKKAANAARLNGQPASSYATDAELDGYATDGELDSYATDADLGTKEDAFKRVVWVTAGSNALTNGDNLWNTMNGLWGKASVDSPYVVKLEPGTYNVSLDALDMLPYVDLEGSGAGRTIIKGRGASSPYTGVVLGAPNSELRDLAVYADGQDADAYAVGMWSSTHDDHPVLRNVKITADGGTNDSIGLFVENGDFEAYDVSVEAFGGGANGNGTGIRLYGVDLKLRDSDILGRFGNEPEGIEANLGGSSSLDIWGSRIEGRSGGAGGTRAIHGLGASMEINNSFLIVEASSGGQAQALYNGIQPQISSKRMRVLNSTIVSYSNGQSNPPSQSQPAFTVVLYSNALQIANSQLLGGGISLSNGGTATCAAVTDENFNATFNGACPG